MDNEDDKKPVEVEGIGLDLLQPIVQQSKKWNTVEIVN